MRYDGPLLRMVADEVPRSTEERARTAQILSKMGTLAYVSPEHSMREVARLVDMGRSYSVCYNPGRKQVNVYDSRLRPVGVGNQVVFKEDPAFTNEAWFYAVYTPEAKKGVFGRLKKELPYLMVPKSAGKFADGRFVLGSDDMKAYPIAWLSLT